MNASSAYDVRTVDLERGQLITLRNRRGTCIRVLHGGAWLTEEGHPDDRFARAGQGLHLVRRGHAVVEALEPTRLVLTKRVGRIEAAMARWLAGPGRRSMAGTVAFTLSVVIALGLPELVARGFLGV